VTVEAPGKLEVVRDDSGNIVGKRPTITLVIGRRSIGRPVSR
jgi:hypothetical protein